MLPVAILAGGLATRMRPLTIQIPKILLPVGGKPFAEHQLELLKLHGVQKIVYCVGYLGDAVRDALGDGGSWGMQFAYVFDGPVLAGTAGSIKRALKELGDSFFVLYGDSYLECDYLGIARTFEESKKLGLMTVLRNGNRWDNSNVDYSAGRICGYDKSAKNMQYIDYGLSAFRSEAFKHVSLDRPADLSEVYRELIRQDELAGYEVANRFYEIGSPTGLAETEDYLMTRRPHTAHD